MTLKANQIFSVHTTMEEFKNVAVTAYFRFAFEKISEGKIKS